MYQSFSHNNHKISYQKSGTLNPVVVLIHGFPEDGTVFEKQYSFLKQNFTVLIPDLPGSGQSAYNPDLQSIEDFAEIIKLILEQENIDRCFLLGHSMGGYIALSFAEKYPGYLLGLGLIHSTAYEDSAEKKENRQRSIRLMERYGGYYFLKSIIPDLFTEAFVAAHPTVVEQLIEKGRSFETKALQQYYFIMMHRKDGTNILQSIKAPVLFIIGEQDRAVPAQDMLQQVSLPQISFIKILSNAAHMGFLEESEKVNEVIYRFMNYPGHAQKMDELNTPLYKK